MASKHNLTIVDAIDMLLSGKSVLVATDVALQHGLEHAIQFHNPTAEHFDAWLTINREWNRRRETEFASGESIRPSSIPCEFTC